MSKGRPALPPAASILLVDDYPANLLALEAILAPLGHQLVKAESGEQALKWLLRQEFAVIIMDVQMPGLDGFQTAALIKARERSRHIPIIFLTAISKDAEHIFKGYAHGAVDYLLKPFEPTILRSKVAVFVELWQRGQQLKQKEEALYRLERERLERQSEARFQQLIEAMPQCVFAYGPDGNAYYANRVFRELVGLDDGPLAADRVWEAVHPEDRPRIQQLWRRALASGEPLHGEYRLQRARDGLYRWHILRTLPQYDESGAITGWIGTATDIHDEKEAREHAERASRAKDEFLATISHELRNPLNAILGWTRMLRAGKLDAGQADRAIETIERNAQTQTALVEDMLDVSRIITGKLVLNVGPVDLRQVVTAAIDTFRTGADAKGIEIAVDFDAQVELASGDHDRLQQVVWNLISNAVKFTPRGGNIEVRTRRVQSQVELAVKDSGQGIPAEFLPYVFDRFRQADSSSTRSHGGLGLGLSIVRHLVELHGGTVSCESEGEGRGALFRVRLPVRAVVSEAGERPSGGAPAPRSPRPFGNDAVLDGVEVLVVDDEPDARELLTAVLEHHGARVATAGSTDEALELLRAHPPAVLVSDIGMPVADGYELIRRVRALGARAGGDTPAAALTGFARPEDGRRALAAGFQTHLAKPVDPAELVDAVYRLSQRPRDCDGVTASAS